MAIGVPNGAFLTGNFRNFKKVLRHFKMISPFESERLATFLEQTEVVLKCEIFNGGNV